MVTVGFIVEGHSEAALIKDARFINFLASLSIYCNPQLVINAKGKYYLYHPKGDFAQIGPEVNSMIKLLKDRKAEVIFLLIDFDNSDPCFTQFKSKVYHQQGNIVVVAKQALEAWYLADTTALSTYIGVDLPAIANPEQYPIPFDKIKALKFANSGRGVSDKKFLTKHMLDAGFSLTRAAAHPNCPSATYFLNKLQSLNTP
jgi:hypothetical protein